ncbi:hypothetical protein HMF7854_05155 [Sphingomonas ginkgonis]|uniref:Anti-sigma K factor RskA C-terminal domain-containing protein n=1 Tax=Sphingomonas ginkgonis TaxID=2315330 RepID=A0A429V8J3_9SPHN|nr:anti-sigma factor [Sphingomonas ginkgonis]RST30276.1 hypothetical protein HMF7854_05155 [Sphingomonas ginkgonis]
MTELELLAAEHAVGLLEGEELLEARRLEATDAVFGDQLSEWRNRLAPLLDEVADRLPPESLWARVVEAIDRSQVPGAGAELIDLQRRIRRWKGATGLASAIAASLALVLVIPMGRTPPPAPRPTPVGPAPISRSTMMASLPMTKGPGVVSVSIVPGTSALLVDAATIRAVAGRDHQLWLIPASTGAKPLSLGLVRAGRMDRMAMPSPMLDYLKSGATIALSREPVGGSTTGLPTGPVVASGRLQEI